MHNRAIAIRDVVVARNYSETAAFRQDIERLADFYEEADRNMQAMMAQNDVFTAEEKQILRDIANIEAKTLPIMSSIIEAKTANQLDEVTNMVLDEALPAFNQWLAKINQFIDYQERENQRLTPQARDIASGFQTLMLILTAVA